MEQAKPNYLNFFIYLFLGIAILGGIAYFYSRDNSKSNIASDSEEKDNSTDMAKNKKYTSAPKMTISQDKKYKAVINTTKGPITVELFNKETPITVNNFVFLAKEGFYNNTVFHRIIKDFMIQGGDPLGNGTGGPGYKFDDEKITRDYKKGTLAMANSGPNTNGSQFFIMHKDNNLPKSYVIFGQVVSGMDAVDAIASVPVTQSSSGEKSVPSESIKIEKISITEE